MVQVKVLEVEGEILQSNGYSRSTLTRKMEEIINAFISTVDVVLDITTETEFATRTYGGRALIIIKYENVNKTPVIEKPVEIPSNGKVDEVEAPKVVARRGRPPRVAMPN